MNDDKQDRAQINLKKSRINTTMALSIGVAIITIAALYLVFNHYYDDKNSPTMNKNLQTDSTVNRGDITNTTPQFEISDEKNIEGTDYLAIYTKAGGKDSLSLICDVIITRYHSKGKFTAFFFNDKAVASGYLKQKTGDYLVKKESSDGIAKLVYDTGGEKILYINVNGKMTEAKKF